MFIIIIVALDCSHCDNGFTYHDDDTPDLPHRLAAARRESGLVFQPRLQGSLTMDGGGSNTGMMTLWGASRSTTANGGEEEIE